MAPSAKLEPPSFERSGDPQPPTHLNIPGPPQPPHPAALGSCCPEPGVSSLGVPEVGVSYLGGTGEEGCPRTGHGMGSPASGFRGSKKDPQLRGFPGKEGIPDPGEGGGPRPGGPRTRQSQPLLPGRPQGAHAAGPEGEAEDASAGERRGSGPAAARTCPPPRRGRRASALFSSPSAGPAPGPAHTCAPLGGAGARPMGAEPREAGQRVRAGGGRGARRS